MKFVASLGAAGTAISIAFSVWCIYLTIELAKFLHAWPF